MPKQRRIDVDNEVLLTIKLRPVYADYTLSGDTAPIGAMKDTKTLLYCESLLVFWSDGDVTTYDNEAEMNHDGLYFCGDSEQSTTCPHCGKTIKENDDEH